MSSESMVDGLYLFFLCQLNFLIGLGIFRMSVRSLKVNCRMTSCVMGIRAYLVFGRYRMTVKSIFLVVLISIVSAGTFLPWSTAEGPGQIMFSPYWYTTILEMDIWFGV